MKNLCKWLLIIALVTALCCGIATADTVASGTCGDSLTWTLDSDGLLTISGTGAMTDYGNESKPWGNNDVLRSLVLEEGVTHIGNNAFTLSRNLTSVTLSESLASIGNTAFVMCQSLTGITLPEALTSIGDRAFLSCEGIAEFNIPARVSYIGLNALNFGANSSTAITVNAANPYYTVINGILYNADVTELIVCPTAVDGAVSVPDTVSQIAYNAFGNSKIQSVTLPDSVTGIGKYAFEGCGRLAEIQLPDDLTTIDVSTFNHCTSLSSIVLPDGITVIEASAFNDCPQLSSIFLPSGLTTVGIGAFRGCTSLANVYYSGTEAQWNAITITEDGNESLINATFHYNYAPVTDFEYTVNDGSAAITKYTGSAADVVIPDTLDSNPVTAIEDQAFMFCDSVETVTIPASVTRIGRDAFSQVPISAVNVAAANETYASIDGVLFNKDCTTLIYYPSGRSGAQYPTYTVPDSVTEIGKNAFLQSLLQHITLPEHLTVIGEGAFAQCMSLTEIYVPDGVTAIGTDTFYLCSNLTEISLPAGLISVSGFAFAEVPTCTINYRGPVASVPNIDIGEYNGCLFSTPWHCTDGDYVFSDSGTCGEHLTWAYSGNTLTISGTGPMENYNDYGGAPWFKYAPVITHVVIDNGVTSIGDWAFSAFESLTGVPLPASLATIGNNAFNNCWRLTDVYYPGTEAQWNAITIGEGNSSLTSATIFYNSHPDSQLPTPVISNVNTEGTIGRDVGFDYHCAEGTERVSLMVGLVDDSGNFEPLENVGISDYEPYRASDAVQLEGYHFQTPGTYQIRVKAYTWAYGEEPSETIADSETAIYEFTLEDAELPTITVELSATKTEYDYGDSELDNLTYSISGVDNVALAWWVYSEQTDDVNGSSLSGGYESFGRLDADAGRNEYTFYGRVNGVWSKPVTKIITVFPLLDVPAIYYNGNYVDSAWIITDGESPIFTVESDNATAFTCTVLKELEDGSEDTLAYAESSNGVIDLTSYNLPLGTYYLNFGVSSDRWTSPDNKRITLTITDSPVLPAPTITVAPGTSHQDMAITVTGSEDTDKIEVSVEGIMNNGEGNELYSGSVNNGGTLTVPGWFIDGNNYKITATGKRLESEEGSVQTWVCGNQAVLAVTREDPEPEPEHPHKLTFNKTEGYSGEITMTVEGAEAIAYLAIYEGQGGGRPDEYHDGSTVTLEAEGGDFGRYEIYCWARFSGLWYWVNSGEVTILPSGELAVPAVSLNGQTLTRNTLQTVALADPMTLAASCAKADSISYQVAKVNGSFDMSLVHFTEDGSYMELTSGAGMDGWDDNEYDWTKSFWMGRSGSTSSINILDELTLVPGDYRVMITAYSDDSGIKKGQFVAWLRIPPTSGTCGENMTWALNDGTLTISGTGDMFDYDWNTGAPWKDASAEIRTIVIGNGVTGIGDYAFRSCAALTSVTLPEGLTRIGDAAFMRCSALADITLPSTLKIIGPSAFESTGIQEITLYDGLTSIGEYAFMDSALRKINIPAGTATKSEVFFVHNWQKDKDELIRITVPESVTDLDVSDFFGTFLPAVEPGFVTPADLTTIESEAFSGIAASYIWLTDNVQSIGANAFSGCTGLQYIRIPNNCTTFGANAFPAGTILLVDYNADAYDALEAAGYTNIMQLVEGFNG